METYTLLTEVRREGPMVVGCLNLNLNAVREVTGIREIYIFGLKGQANSIPSCLLLKDNRGRGLGFILCHRTRRRSGTGWGRNGSLRAGARRVHGFANFSGRGSSRLRGTLLTLLYQGESIRR